MIYGDNPQNINKRQDALGLTTYTTVPQLSAILQSGNLYIYCINNPVGYVDANGHFVITATTLLILGGAAIFGTIGGFIGNHIANQAGATGMKKAKYIVAGVCVGGILGGAVGTAVAPYAAAAGFGGIAVTSTGVSVVATGGALVVPEYVKNAGSFITWITNNFETTHQVVTLPQIKQLVEMANRFGVKISTHLSGHPGSKWPTAHVHFGNNRVHIAVADEAIRWLEETIK